MNLILDTLRSRRSFRWLGHGLGLLAGYGFLWIAGWSKELWIISLWTALSLGVSEILFSLADFKARRLRALAPIAFPFKNLPEADRVFVQNALLRIPKASALRAFATWFLAMALVIVGRGLFWGMAEFPPVGAFIILSFPVSAIIQYLGNSAMGRRVAPFYYFEGDTPDELSKRMPSLSKRFTLLTLLPLSVLLPLPVISSTFQQQLTPLLWLWLFLWALAILIAAKRVFQDVVIAPIEDLGSALGKFGSGDYNALLDVTSGDELGVTTNRFNKAVRATDRRFFVRENFGHSIPEVLVEDLFEGGLKLDGESREVGVIAIRLLNASAPPAAFNRFCEVAQGPLDKFGACVETLEPGLLVAVFNAPLKIENPGHAAALCAWVIKEVLQVFRTQQKMQKGLDLPFSIGLGYGPALCALAGPRGRQNYKTFGSPRAQAIEGTQREGFWISPDLTMLLGPDFDFEAKPK